jgi:hypothetical protein
MTLSHRTLGEKAARRSFVLYAALALAFIVGAWLRFDQLAMQVVMEDEWHPVHQVIYYTPLHILSTFGNADYCIPLTLLYFLVAKTWGLSEIGLRLPVVVAGLTSVIVIPLFLSRRVGDRIAAVLAILLATSPFLVSYSRIARSYSITLLGIYTAFWLLDRAVEPLARPDWRSAAGYALVCGFTVWAHPVTGPVLVSPLIWLWWQRLRGEGPEWSHLIKLTALTGGCMASAVLPPLLGDMQALAGKSGVDTVTLPTVIGAWHLWVGTGSAWIALGALAFALLGLGHVWKATRMVRWVVLGSAITLAIILATKPWWVDRPLAFARYLIFAVPVILVAVSAGIVRCVDAASSLVGTATPRGWAGLSAAVVALILVWVPFTPYPDVLRRPNSYAQHSVFQFDYRRDRNPIPDIFLEFPASAFWATLSHEPRGSIVVAVAPFQYSSYLWPAPRWEESSGQRVIPAFVWGACEQTRKGEIPPDSRFRFRNAVHIVAPREQIARRAQYLAFYRNGGVRGTDAMPECEQWMRQRFGAPYYEDAALIAWKMSSTESQRGSR